MAPKDSIHWCSSGGTPCCVNWPPIQSVGSVMTTRQFICNAARAAAHPPTPPPIMARSASIVPGRNERADTPARPARINARRVSVVLVEYGIAVDGTIRRVLSGAREDYPFQVVQSRLSWIFAGIHGSKRSSWTNKQQISRLRLLIQSIPFVSPCCLLYTSPSPRDRTRSRMPSSA